MPASPRKSRSRRASPSTASAGSSRFRGPPACGSTAGLPARSGAAGPALGGIADIAARRAAVRDAILGAYPMGGSAATAGAIAPPPGHPPGLDPTAVFLARVLVPVGPDDPPQRTDETVGIDNFSRRF